MDLIDTHAHLDLPQFKSDLDDVLNRAQAVGVKYIISIGIDIESSRRAVELAQTYPQVFAAVGIHPHDAKNVVEKDWLILEELLAKPKVVALGEIGLDFYKDYSPHHIQENIFRRQLELTFKHSKPVVIHCREAHEQCLSILKGYKRSFTGVAHCFSGSSEVAREYLALGLKLSLGGPITYPNAHRLRELVSSIKLEDLMLETDCPFLAPQARRGQRNEPAYLTYVLSELSRVYKLPGEEIARITTANAQGLFKLKYITGT